MQSSVGVVLGAMALVVLMAGPAAARQRTVPDTGMNAGGVQMGAAMPSDFALKNGLNLTATFEHYFSARNSVRAAISGAWFDIDGHGFPGTVNPMAFTGNFVHNWERGVWHPYATVGAGLYHYKFSEDRVKSTNNKFGINLGGGAEYFVTRRDTFLGEVLVHIIPGDDVLGTGASYENKYWTLSGGYKRYF